MCHFQTLVFSVLISISCLQAMQEDIELPVVIRVKQEDTEHPPQDEQSNDRQPIVKTADLSNVIKVSSSPSAFHACINLRTIFKDGHFQDVHDGIVSSAYICNSDPKKSGYFCTAAVKRSGGGYDHHRMEDRTSQILEMVFERERYQKMKEKEGSTMFGATEISSIEAALQDHFQEQEKHRIPYARRKAGRKEREEQEREEQEKEKKAQQYMQKKAQLEKKSKDMQT